MRNLKALKLLESRFLATLRNDIKVNYDTVSKAGIQETIDNTGFGFHNLKVIYDRNDKIGGFT